MSKNSETGGNLTKEFIEIAKVAKEWFELNSKEVPSGARLGRTPL